MTDSELHGQSPLELVDLLKSGLMNRATGGEFDGGDDRYRQLRRALQSQPSVVSQLPECVRSCVDLGEFWEFIRDEYGSYQERRVYLRKSFAPVIAFLENNEPDLTMMAVTEMLTELSAERVTEVWIKALHRRRHDPDGAITAARSMLETVCKHILDDASITYGSTDDLPKLWFLAAQRLNLTPGQHQATDIKAILGNCQSVVGGLANLRNAVGDAHGQGRSALKPRAKHAELAVNLAGTMASFLVSTWIEQSGDAERE